MIAAATAATACPFQDLGNHFGCYYVRLRYASVAWPEWVELDHLRGQDRDFGQRLFGGESNSRTPREYHRELPKLLQCCFNQIICPAVCHTPADPFNVSLPAISFRIKKE
jgi:hypothetical protein